MFRGTARARRAALAGLAAGCVVMVGAGAPSASASRYIEQSPGYSCDSRQVRVSPPKVGADRTEAAVWSIYVQRSDGSQWYTYSVSSYYAAFDFYGRNNSGWSVFNTNVGGRFINSRMNIPVYHSGYYRVYSAVATNNQSAGAWISPSYCYMY